MGRRGNSEGTITKRKDGRWEARISLPNGKRKSFYGRTRQEVAQWLVQVRHDLNKGLLVLDERQTVGQYLEGWLETVRMNLRSSSMRRYREHVRRIMPVLGYVPLVKLSAQQVQMLYAQLLGEGLSSTTVRHLHMVLHRALKDALRLGLVQRNVTELVNVPRVAEYRQTPLTEEQASRLLEVVVGDRFEALYVLALTTGMREGELLALQWGDVDFEQGVIQVRQTLRESAQAGKKVYVLAEPKSKTSRRQIALTQIALEALHRHHARQAEERLALGPAWDSSLDLVFPNTIGRLTWPWSLVTRSFKPLLKKAGLPDIRFHDLRHTAATMLLSRGVPVKVVSEMLGHANISITLQVYGHVLPHMQQAAADVMDTVFRGVWLISSSDEGCLPPKEG